MSASLSGLIDELRPYARELDRAVHASGLRGSFTSTLRSHAEQKRLYDRYLRGEAQFPAAPPGQSAHEYGYAFDYLVSPYDYQESAGAYWIDLGGVWHASDAVHFEYPGFTPPPPEESGLPWWASIFVPSRAVEMPVAESKKKIESWAEEFLKSRGL